jgi:hypothetical protein
VGQIWDQSGPKRKSTILLKMVHNRQITFFLSMIYVNGKTCLPQQQCLAFYMVVCLLGDKKNSKMRCHDHTSVGGSKIDFFKIV